MVADEHPVFDQHLEVLPIQIVGEGDGVLLSTIEESLLLKGLQRSMISWAASGIRASVSVEGWYHFYGRTYELSISRSGSLGLQGLAFASLVENDGPMVIFDRASPTTPSALGGPPIGTPSSNDAQDSLEAS